jgi:hypothetical protein
MNQSILKAGYNIGHRGSSSFSGSGNSSWSVSSCKGKRSRFGSVSKGRSQHYQASLSLYKVKRCSHSLSSSRFVSISRSNRPLGVSYQ